MRVLSRWHPRTAARGYFRESLLRAFTDPLIHFLVLGGLLFVVASIWQRAHDPRRIVVDEHTLERISVEYRRRFGETPPPALFRQALAEHVADEVLYREGIARGIDRDDEIVRRRIIQKMRFLQEGQSLPPSPDEETLRHYYARHTARYRAPPRVSFSLVYFAADGGEAPARARAARVLPTLGQGKTNITAVGDAFPDRSTFVDLTETDAEKTLGRSSLTSALFTLPIGRWSGPLTSGFGVHLVRVDHRVPATLLPFVAVRARVLADYVAQAQAEQDRKAMATLAARYEILLPKGATLP